jgi:putative YphP/YqiW family bacilliredoxin
MFNLMHSSKATAMRYAQYPQEIVDPMERELTSLGFESLMSGEEVEKVMDSQEGTMLMVVNSICGCAAANARPGVRMSLSNDKKPGKLVTVFAGVDRDATNKAREYMLPYPPSSPSIALFKDGRLVHFLERHHIEGRPAEAIANNLKMAFERYC